MVEDDTDLLSKTVKCISFYAFRRLDYKSSTKNSSYPQFGG